MKGRRTRSRSGPERNPGPVANPDAGTGPGSQTTTGSGKADGAAGETAGPRERLIQAAIDLFYRRGYAAVSVNEIIAESETHKASFYRHFAGKEDLAREYLAVQRTRFEATLAQLMARAEDPRDFVRRWCALLQRSARSEGYAGCPLARLLGSLGEAGGELQAEAKGVLESWLNLLEKYFADELHAGRLHHRAEPRNVAERFMRLYQGAAQLFVITGDAGQFRRLEEEMLREIG